MKEWQKILVSPDTSILETIAIIDQGSMQIAFVADADGYLLGAVSDGDVRRAILKSIPMSERVRQIMNMNPVTTSKEVTRDQLRMMMSQAGIRQIPVVDAQNRILRIETWQDTLQPSRKTNPVILMAGGMGKRLGHLTASCPKPMLKVGDKPILQTILESFVECGFFNFFFSVNYHADMIMNHFGDGSQWDVKIQYLLEETPLGTAGALRLLPEKPAEPMIVMNGDILTKINFEQLLEFHHDGKSMATMCIRDFQTQVPYGVVDVDQHKLVSIREKPVHHFFVSAGIYVLNPEVIEFIPTDGRLDMPELFRIVIDAQAETAVFPIREYWIDIGRMDDFERANDDYAGVFG